jgi:hypothetical protein
MKALYDLDLRSNNIDDFKQLKPFSTAYSLGKLYLFFRNGNKVTENPRYRMIVTYFMPYLRYLDF